MKRSSPSASADSWYWAGKLAPAHAQPTSVPRVILLKARHTEPFRPLTVVIAPAGYGKTTLLAQWHQAHCVEDPHATLAWLSLDQADAEPSRFLAYVILALDQAGVDLGHLTALAAAQALDAEPERTVHTLLQAVARHGQAITFLLDDYHLAASAPINALTAMLLERGTPWIRWVITSRACPRWPLGQWRANGWVNHVDARALTLSLDEASAILGPEVSEAELHHIHGATEGWAVAVQLARLWRRSPEGATFGASAFSGGTADVAHYLTTHLFDSLSPDSRDFLLDTCVLERFNAQLADTVRARHDSAAQLRALADLDALLVPLDAERRWFRYHALVADFLRTRIEAVQARRVHRRAVGWLTRQRDWSQAVHHALRANDTALAASVVAQAGGWELVLNHGIRYAQALVQQFDVPTCNRIPDLLLLQAYLQAKLGEHRLCTHFLQRVHPLLSDDPRLDRDYHVIKTLADAYQNRFESLPAPGMGSLDQTLAQATLGCVGALAALTRGDPALSLSTVRTAHTQMRGIGNPRGEQYCRLHEAQALAVSGCIDEADRIVDDALKAASAVFGQESALYALWGCLKARQLYLLGDWTLVPPWLAEGWDALAHADGWLDVVATTAEVAWRTRLRSHGLRSALGVLDDTAQLATRREWRALVDLTTAWRIDALVQSGQWASAQDLLRTADLETTAAQDVDWRAHVAATSACTRVQLHGGCAASAITRLQRTAAALDAKGLALPALRLRLLALTAHTKAQPIQRTILAETLAPVLHHGLHGLLLEIGPGLLPALLACVDEHPALQPTIKRLRGWRAHPVAAQSRLGDKESQVLRLLADGHPNKAIARSLAISENTVKYHLKQLYARLGVDNRAAAVATAIRQGHLDASL